MLDYYLKLKTDSYNISYDATSSTGIILTTSANIIVLTQNKSINHSFYVGMYWNQVNRLWVKISDYGNFKITVQLIGYPVTVHNSNTSLAISSNQKINSQLVHMCTGKAKVAS